MRIKGRFFTIANIMSIVRVPIALAACWCIMEGIHVYALILLSLGILTDFFDGKIARATGTVSDWGKILDPLADKIGIIGLVGTLWLLHAIPLWFILVVVFRDALIAGAGILITKKMTSPPSSNKWGKVTTFLMAVYILRITVSVMYKVPVWPSQAILWNVDAVGILAVIFVIISLIVYSADAVKILRNPGEIHEGNK